MYAAQDRLIIALLEIRKVIAVKSKNFSALRAEAPLYSKPSLLEIPSVIPAYAPDHSIILICQVPKDGHLWAVCWMCCQISGPRKQWMSSSTTDSTTLGAPSTSLICVSKRLVVLQSMPTIWPFPRVSCREWAGTEYPSWDWNGRRGGGGEGGLFENVQGIGALHDMHILFRHNYVDIESAWLLDQHCRWGVRSRLHGRYSALVELQPKASFSSTIW